MTFTLPRATESEFELTPEGLYVFRLKSMEAGIQGNPEFGGGERVKWVFDIEEVISATDEEEAEEFVGKEFWAWTSMSMNRKATMRAWVIALLGRDVTEQDEVTSDLIVGKRCRATVQHYKKQTGDTGSKITGMMAHKKNAKPRRNLPPPTDPEGFDDEDDEDF